MLPGCSPAADTANMAEGCCSSDSPIMITLRPVFVELVQCSLFTIKRLLPAKWLARCNSDIISSAVPAVAGTSGTDDQTSRTAHVDAGSGRALTTGMAPPQCPAGPSQPPPYRTSRQLGAQTHPCSITGTWSWSPTSAYSDFGSGGMCPI
jgi:hypothetical protein